jgi:hypothetical protein
MVFTELLLSDMIRPAGPIEFHSAVETAIADALDGMRLPTDYHIVQLAIFSYFRVIDTNKKQN